MCTLVTLPCEDDSHAGLLRRRRYLLGQVAKLDATLASELHTVLLALGTSDFAAGDFADVATPLEAILLFLERSGAWSDKKAIARSIMDGGFRADPVRGIGYLVGVVDYAVEKGKLRQVHELIGLPGWDPATQDRRLMARVEAIC